MYAWGRNSEGQLGIGRKCPSVETPTLVEGLEGKAIKMIAAGESHTLFLSDGGEVYSCGDYTDGKLGVGVKISA